MLMSAAAVSRAGFQATAGAADNKPRAYTAPRRFDGYDAEFYLVLNFRLYTSFLALAFILLYCLPCAGAQARYNTKRRASDGTAWLISAASPLG